MKLFEIIEEGAINTSDIAQKADDLLTNLFLSIIKRAAKECVFTYDYYQEQRNNKYVPSKDLKSRSQDVVDYVVHEMFSKKDQSGAWACVYQASNTLTKLVQDNILKDYGVSLAQDGKNDGVLIDQQYYPIGNVRVIVRHTAGGYKAGPESGLMHRASSGSTFGVHSDKVNPAYPKYSGLSIIIHNTEQWKENFEQAVYNQISIDIIGDALDYEPEYYIDMMVDEILSIFTHEFDHLLFYLKKTKHTPYSSRSAFKSDTSGHSYDNHVDFDNPKDYERYLGSDIELQAWASDQAIKLVRQYVTVKRRDYSVYKKADRNIEDPKIWNQEIDQLIDEIKNNSVRHSYDYKELIHKKIKELGGNQVAYQKVWRKYLQLLIKKIQHYKK